jgi:hypothetical protein
MESDSCVSGGRLSVYIYFKVLGFTVFVQVKEFYFSFVFLCRIEFYATVYLVYVCFNELSLCLIGVLCD